MTKLELKQKELIELLKRIFETDTLDLPKVDKLESKIAKLEKQAETESIHERIKPYISDREAVVSKWIKEDKEKQAESEKQERVDSLTDWKTEYDAAVNEIGQLQDQLKEAENEIIELNNQIKYL
jgi:chromosome segregation ATPase